jgi:DeoR/GlpR family transcriptional regulator of sugar metabolism
MLSQERQQRIVDLIRVRKSVQVVELSETLKISLSTVRRDLAEIEELGLIQRVHGGAILRASAQEENEPAAVLRADQNSEAKRAIAEAAAQLVDDGETIILTAGSTVDAMIPFLGERKNLTVITNVINIAYRLTAYPHINVVVLGGWLRHSEFSLLGHLTQQAIKELHAHKIFHGTFGLDAEYGLTGVYMQEVETDRLLIDAADQLIVVADKSKFDHMGQVRIVPSTRIHTLVTDAAAPDRHIKALRAQGIRVLLA